MGQLSPAIEQESIRKYANLQHKRRGTEKGEEQNNCPQKYNTENNE